MLTLIVDIEYRNKYGKSLDRSEGKGYKMNTNQVLGKRPGPSAKLSGKGIAVKDAEPGLIAVSWKQVEKLTEVIGILKSYSR